MAEVIITPQARGDVEAAIVKLNLPGDTWTRIARSARVIETFPQAGRPLQGRWAEARFVLGPWPWMILLYRYEESSDRVYIVAVDDARSAGSGTSG